MPRDFAKQAGTKSIKRKPALKRKNNSPPETRRLRDFLWGSCFGFFLSILGFYFLGTTASENLVELVAQKGTSVPEIIYENDSFDFDKKLKSSNIKGDAGLYSTPKVEKQLSQITRLVASMVSGMGVVAGVVMGDMNWHNHVGLYTAAPRIAVQYKIPLILYF